jgi:starch phosphorylase
VLVNGGINLSELDGWWAEAYNPEVGWALGDGKEHNNDKVWDAIEAEQLYNILEQQVVPEFYSRNEKGIPTAWISRMKESMAQLTPRFSADRTVREYTGQHYLKAASAYSDRSANKGMKAEKIVDMLHTLMEKWESMRFGEIRITTVENQHKFNVQVFFNDIDPDLLQVELYADGLNGEPPIIQKMKRDSKSKGTVNEYHYFASVTSSRTSADFTPRVIPTLSGVSVPLETALILWQH